MISIPMSSSTKSIMKENRFVVDEINISQKRNNQKLIIHFTYAFFIINMKK